MVFHHYLWSLFLHFDIVLLMFHMLFCIDQYFHIIDLCFSPAGLIFLMFFKTFVKVLSMF